MRNIRTEWFYNEKSPKEIKCPIVGLLKNKEDALCYLLALNLYPKLYPQDIGWVTLYWTLIT
ncbi:hypothetical protein [Spiroplasma ixodetis]|uniref:hypothetical protein n=1 Tax=Spiroplasma ixodetis TaxID=2141 RepID=UPI0025772E1C|nr:hypothetical protein [Spiroplasma ixodetis]WJG70396.1 hypothetical protein SIXOD_v1c15290 [Spiroplasma ixodetis Y32]